MSTLREVPAPKVSPYLQFLYGLFNLLFIGALLYSCFTAGPFQKSHSNVTSGTQNSSSSSGQPCDSSLRNCPPVQPGKLISKISKPVENFHRSYAEGRAWHTPYRFPRCSMDACFNYSRCEDLDELLIYHYDTVNAPHWCFKDAFKRSPFYTNDPEQACLFLVAVDRRLENSDVPPFSTLPYWNHGMNHVIVSFVDNWAKGQNPKPNSIEAASTMTSITHQSTYRAGFDISIPLPQKKSYTHLQGLKALDKKYFLTFKGPRYLGDGGFSSSPILRGMHNGKDVIVAMTCRQNSRTELLQRDPQLESECSADQTIYNQFKFDDLMNSTFGLAPASSGPSSFRLLEIMSAGSIPVLISDNFVLPFDTLVEWRRCLFLFPASQMHRIVHTLRSLKREEIVFRREYCLFIYREFLVDDDKIVETAALALKARLFGVLPKLIPHIPLAPTHLGLGQIYENSL